MRRLTIYGALFAFVLGVAITLSARAVLSEAARARRPNGQHCGCLAGKKECAEPCVACCGPNGYADCFKNPNPGTSEGCCGGR